MSVCSVIVVFVLTCMDSYSVIIRRLIDEPRVTRFKIDWGVAEQQGTTPMPTQQQQQVQMMAPQVAPMLFEYDAGQDNQIADWIREMQEDTIMYESSI